MSASEHLIDPAAAAVGGALAGKVLVARAGLTAAGMVGSGTGIGAAAGPVGMIAGAVTGLAVYAVLRALGAVAEEQADLIADRLIVERQARVVAANWADEWHTEVVERTGDLTDRVPATEVVASFDAWLERTLGGTWRPEGWKIWTSRVAAMERLGVDPDAAGMLLGLRLREPEAT